MTALGDLAYQTEIVAAITDPRTNEPLTTEAGEPMTVTLAGPAHPDYQVFAAASQQEGATNAHLLALQTIAWNLEWEPGKPLPFSRDEAEALYAKAEFRWFANQVAEKATDVDGFFGRSAPSGSGRSGNGDRKPQEKTASQSRSTPAATGKRRGNGRKATSR